MTGGADSAGDYAHCWAWEPLTPEDVAGMMRGFAVPWWICGGCALDLFLGRDSRRHDDLDVALLRRDQAALRSHFSGWDLWYATEGHSLEPWDGTRLELPVHGIWARRSSDPHSAWACEFLLNEASDDEWVFRRDDRVRRPLADVGETRNGVPYLRPEVVLLYKASEPSPKNEADFSAVFQSLSREATTWLAEALQVSRPQHHWIERLA